MSRLFINRPVVAMVIAILIVLAGLVSFQRLPVAQFPDIAPPEISIRTMYVGADALTIEESVATPIEQTMTGVDNMIYMRSYNVNDGTMNLRVDFEVGTDPNVDNVLTYIRLAQAIPQLPSAVQKFGLSVLKAHTSPLAVFALYSPKGTYDATFLANYAYVNINDPMTRVNGIGQVLIQGAGQYAMRQWLKPDQLASLGVTVTDIVSALEKQNVINAAGQVGAEPSPPGQQFTYTMRTQGRLVTDEEFGDVVIRANPDGSVIRMRDVARVELGAQTYNNIGRLNGAPAAIISVFQLPGFNAVEAMQGARRLLEELKTRFPVDMDYVVSLDTTLAVTDGLREIYRTLWQALLLVILVVFVFLQSVRATLIPAVAVPVSLVGTFMFFPLLGFSVNTLSLFGLVLAIGLVVDDAIVVVEAVEKKLEDGLPPKEAAMQAMAEVSGPVVAIALILIAVFVPTAFIPGVTGRLYQQFAVTIAISVAISAFTALTLSPALCALLLKPHTERRRGPLGIVFGAFNRGFARATNGYVGLCGLLIRKFAAALLFLAALAAGAGILGWKLPGGFLPTEDQGYLYLNVQLPEASALPRTDAVMRKIEKILADTPGVRYYSSITGYSLLDYINATYFGFFFVTLDPWSERRTPATSLTGIIDAINRRLDQLSEARATAFPPPAIAGVGTAGGFSLMLQDRAGKSVDFLATNVNRFLDAARQRPELTRLHSSLIANVPQVYADVDRDKVLKQEVDLEDVYRTLNAFMGSLFVNYFNRFGRQWQVYIGAEGRYRTRAEDVGQFYVRNRRGQMVPLAAIVRLETREGPEYTNRFNEYRAAEIQGGAAPGYSSGQAMAALEEVARQVLPPEMGYAWNALSYQQHRAAQQANPLIIFGLSLLVVFLILAAQYESWSLPFSVLLATPVAVFGALLALSLRRFENDVYAQIGLVMLIGLAAKNAILIVEFARAERARGTPIREAALAGARLRLRPILMTAFAFIFGALPLVIASGSGAVARQILGTAVVGGMLAASTIAIFMVPVAYFVVERVASGRGGREDVRPVAPARERTRVMRPRTGLSALASLLIAVAGCAVGPDYHRPQMLAPTAFRGEAALPEATSLADLPWWEVFRDPALKGLIQEALAGNYDLRIAVARVGQARALAGVARADFFPWIDYGAGAQRARGVFKFVPELELPAGGTDNLFIGGLSATWEIDVWGRIRRSNEAARAEMLATEEARRGVLLTLVGDVAEAYFALLALDLRLTIANSATDSFQRTYTLFRRRFEAGVVSTLQTSRAEGALASAAATIPDIERQITIRENQINLLLGRDPGPVPRGVPLVEQQMPPTVPPGVPSVLLERRPDVREAEQRLVKANAQIGVAKAAFFPRIGLTALLGAVSPELSALTSGTASLWALAGSLTGPLFQGGRILEGYRASTAAWEQARLQYEVTALRAFQEVSDALVALQKLARFEAEQARSVAALEQSVRVANRRYLGGLASYYEVLEAQQLLFPAQDLLARVRRDRFLALVGLYKALGGGWNLPDAQWRADAG